MWFKHCWDNPNFVVHSFVWNLSGWALLLICSGASVQDQAPLWTSTDWTDRLISIDLVLPSNLSQLSRTHPHDGSLLRWMPCFIVLQTTCSTRCGACGVRFPVADPSVGAESSKIEELVIVCSDFGHHYTFTSPLALRCSVWWVVGTCGLLN